jgi:hypothetical protein
VAEDISVETVVELMIEFQNPTLIILSREQSVLSERTHTGILFELKLTPVPMSKSIEATFTDQIHLDLNERVSPRQVVAWNVRLRSKDNSVDDYPLCKVLHRTAPEGWGNYFMSAVSLRPRAFSSNTSPRRPFVPSVGKG